MRSRTWTTGTLLAVVLAGDLLALRVLVPPAPRPVDEVVLDYRATVPAPVPTAGPVAEAVAVRRAAVRPLPSAQVRAAAPRPRAAASAAPVPAPAPVRDLPLEPGVYAYATTGSEQVELVGTDRHDYPSTTAVTVRRTACGASSTWEPVQGRSERRDVCTTPAGRELRALGSVHSFLRISDERRYACPPGAVVVPRRPVPGRTTSGRCRGDDGGRLVLTTTVVAAGLRERVGGEAVEVVRLRVTGVLEGDETGSSTEDRWVTASGLVVRSRAVTRGEKATPLGTARYTERVDLRLTSLHPQR